MISLLIDTATNQGSIALYENERLLDSEIFSSESNHLQILHSSVDRMLKKTKTAYEQVDCYGVDTGPGSFTGIRIGVTTARTFAQLGKKYIFGVPSLDIISRGAPSFPGLICVALDGKKNRIFTGFYVFRANSPKRISDYFDLEPNELLVKINKYKKKYNEILFLGSAQATYQEILKKNELKSVFTPEKHFYPEAKNMYFCMKEQKLTKNYENILPFYLRPSDAETKR